MELRLIPILVIAAAGLWASPELLSIDQNRQVLDDQFHQQLAKSEGWFWTPELVKILAFGHLPVAVDSVLITFSVSEPNSERGSRQGRSAGYYELDTASSLDPGYLEIYSQGANYLAVVRHDPVGSKMILDRGMKFQQEVRPHLPPESAEYQWPFLWHVPLNLAYVELFELEDLASAAEHFLIAAEVGDGPIYLQELARRLSHRSSAAELGLRLLDTELRQSHLDPELRTQLTHRRLMIERLVGRLLLEERLEAWKATQKRINLKGFRFDDESWPKDRAGREFVREMRLDASGKVIDPVWSSESDPWLVKFEQQVRTFKLGDRH